MPLSGAALVVLSLATVLQGHQIGLAVYALSFWHYVLYWFAYRHGTVAHGLFKHDAVAAKTVSLAALAVVYLAAPPDLLSLAVVAAGFGLNAIAARALGTDRTYYGEEVAGLPPQRITAFPYGWIAHPMLVGNIAAFGGTLINAAFRAEWWPLAAIHVAHNIGLLVMETSVSPLRRRSPGGQAASAKATGSPRVSLGGLFFAAVLLGALLGGAAGGWGLGPELALPGAIIGVAAYIHMAVIRVCYTLPPSPPAIGRNTPTEATR